LIFIAKIVAALRLWLFGSGISGELIPHRSPRSHRLECQPEKCTRLGRQILIVWTKRS
jgi:hypothetical protein